MNAKPEIKISGFTMVRNATRLGYPLRESILSVLSLCEEFIINLGDSTDDTTAICEKLQHEFPTKIKLLHSVWNRDEQSGGYQLKHQTDIALAACKYDWCFYIQADEVFHENDVSILVKAIEQANQLPDIDGLVFQYTHFYGSYDYTISGRNWYRREVRVIRNRRGIQSFRDAQGFRRANGERIRGLLTDARIFHYGYVRDSSSLKTKSEAMATWWGEKAPENSEAFELRRHVGLRRFTKTHPATMKTRIVENHCSFDPSKCRRIWDSNEIKNFITFLWESIVPYRIGEYRNYEATKHLREHFKRGRTK